MGINELSMEICLAKCLTHNISAIMREQNGFKRPPVGIAHSFTGLLDRITAL